MKILLIFLLTIACHLSYSQDQLPNSNFEDWTISANNRDSLIGWSSTSSVYPYPVISLYKDTAAYQGDYCANAVTAPFGVVQQTLNGILVNGEADFSFPFTGFVEGGGTPISIKPTELNGYYKNQTLSTGDHAVARILVSKYNTSLQQRDTISYSVYNFTLSDEFAYFSIPLYDLAPGVMPDTITTVFFVSNPATLPTELGYGLWSNLFLDNLNLVPLNTTAIASNTTDQEMTIFPNPTKGMLTIAGIKGYQIDVYNTLGSLVKTIKIDNNQKQYQLDISAFPRGVYSIEVHSEKGIFRKQLVKE